MEAELRLLVRQRAGNRCEYCGLRQEHLPVLRFHDVWETHFERRGALIVGRTPIGRTTVQVLNMNDPENVQLRIELLTHGQLD